VTHDRGHYNRSNIKIAINPPRIARLRSNSVQSLSTAWAVYYTCSRSKVKVTGPKVKVNGYRTISAVKCYKTAMGRLSDLKLVMSVVIKVDSHKYWRQRREASSCIVSQLPHFLVLRILRVNSVKVQLLRKTLYYMLNLLTPQVAIGQTVERKCHWYNET